MKPTVYLFAFSQRSGQVHLTHDDEHHPAHVKTHIDLAQDIGEQDLIHGYAYRIKGGWRVFDYNHDPMHDAHIRRRVVETIGAREAGEEHTSALSDPIDMPGPSHLLRTHYGRPIG